MRKQTNNFIGDLVANDKVIEKGFYNQYRGVVSAVNNTTGVITVTRTGNNGYATQAGTLATTARTISTGYTKIANVTLKIGTNTYIDNGLGTLSLNGVNSTITVNYATGVITNSAAFGSTAVSYTLTFLKTVVTAVYSPDGIVQTVDGKAVAYGDTGFTILEQAEFDGTDPTRPRTSNDSMYGDFKFEASGVSE